MRTDSVDIDASYEHGKSVIMSFFRFFPEYSQDMLEAANESGIGPLVEGVSEKFQNSGADIGSIIDEIEKVLSVYLRTELNKKDDKIIFWHDEVVQILYTDGKCFLVDGELKEGESELIKKNIRGLLKSVYSPVMNIAFIFIDVLNKDMPIPLDHLWYDD